VRQGAAAVTVVLSLAAGCFNRDASSLGARGPYTALRPNEAGKVLRIGSACKPEDGWQYTFPPGWPTGREAADSGVPTALPIPPDYKETHQLEPGIGYCVTHLRTHPNGFFTSNCRADSDCPREGRCDGSWCNVPCATNDDCGDGLYCPSNSGRARFCREGCPAVMPPAGQGCYDSYGGPWLCPYSLAAGAETICRCVLKPLNDAVWECTPDTQCPESAPGESPCRAGANAPLTCSFGDLTCRCEAGRFQCSPGHPTDAAPATTATATTEAGASP
jgi:hypothetical protein